MERPTFLEEINSTIIKQFDAIDEYDTYIRWYDSGCPSPAPDYIDSTSSNLTSYINRCRYFKHLHELLIKELRNARDNGDGNLLSIYSKGKDWNEASVEEQERMEQCWINLTLLTLKINKHVLFVRGDSPKDWKERTKEWIFKYNLKF
jgi:hypothetical protein